MDREIPDNRELTKIGWSVVKILGLWFLMWLLSHCVANAQTTGQAFTQTFLDDYNYLHYEPNDPDAYQFAPISDTVYVEGDASTTYDFFQIQDGPVVASCKGGGNVVLGVGGGISENGGPPAAGLYYVTANGVLVGTLNINPTVGQQLGYYDHQNVTPATEDQSFTLNFNAPSTSWSYSASVVDADTSKAHTVNAYLNGVLVQSNSYGPVTGTMTSTFTAGSAAYAGESYSITLDGNVVDSGTVAFSEGGTVDTVLGGVINIAGGGGSSPTPSPTPSGSPTPSPTPGGSPTPSPTPDGGGGSSPTPTPTGGDGSGSGLTEPDIETAIRNTFGDTTGQPDQPQDFVPKGNYSPPPDDVSPALDASRSSLESAFGLLNNLVPDLSSFQGLGTNYLLQIDCSGFQLGWASFDFTPYKGAIGLVRGAVLAVLSLVFVVKFINHLGVIL